MRFSKEKTHNFITVPLTCLRIFEGQLFIGQIHPYLAALDQFAEQDFIGQGVFDFGLQDPGQGSCPYWGSWPFSAIQVLAASV